MDLKFLSSDVETCAKRLLGCYLVRTINRETIKVKIIETEGYHQDDAASHSYKGETPRTSVMFGKPARAYVYFTYGMHHCFNIVTGKEGEGSGVLIRAVEPLENRQAMQRLRTAKTLRELSNGPAKLCQALGIDRTLNKHDLSQKPLQLLPGEPVAAKDITITTRIGIRKDTNRLWRFYITGSEYVSVK